MALVTQRFELDDRHVSTWREQVCELMLDADTDWTDGTVLGINFGVTGLTGGVVHLDCRTRHAGLMIARTAERVARTPGAEIMGLSYVTSGEASIDTGAGHYVVRAGELCLLSSRQPFTKRLSGGYHEEFLYFHLPSRSRSAARSRRRPSGS
jgi:hypothetical protein